MTPEGKEKQRIKALLARYDVLHFSPKQDGMGTNGVSDLLCCVSGHYLAIEAKAPGGEPTQMQMKFMRDVCLAGGSAMVVGQTEQQYVDLEHLLRERVMYGAAPVAAPSFRAPKRITHTIALVAPVPEVPEPKVPSRKKPSGLKAGTEKQEWPR